MDAIRLGLVIRALRRRRGWRQADLAGRAGLSASSVSRIESGRIGSMTLDALRATGAALDAQVDIGIRWHGEALDRLLDAAHAALVEALVRRLQAGGWQVAVEVSFAIRGERGSIDVLAYHEASGLLAVAEVKASIGDVQATIHPFDRKSRLALEIARERGWAPGAAVRLLAVSDDRTTRRRVATHRAVFDAAFPVRGRDAGAWIDDPAGRALGAVGGARPAGTGSGRPGAPTGVIASALLFLPRVQREHARASRGGRVRVHVSRGRAV